MEKIALNCAELCHALGINRATVDRLEQYEQCPLPFFSLPGSYEHLYSFSAVSKWTEELSNLQSAEP